MSNMKTISGIAPTERREIPYDVTTNEAEAFLQKKFDAIVKQMNREIRKYNEDHPDEDDYPLEDDVEVNLITNRMSSKFYPFVLVLPSSVLKDGSKKRGKNELDIFNPQHSEQNANMKKPMYDIIQPFLYDDNDKKSFFSTNFQHALKISSRTAGSLKANCRPKIHYFDKDRVSYVVVLLDPLRLFHNMLTLVDDKTPYDIMIDNVEQLKAGNFKYHISRVAKSKNKKNKKGLNFDKAIMQKINGR